MDDRTFPPPIPPADDLSEPQATPLPQTGDAARGPEATQLPQAGGVLDAVGVVNFAGRPSLARS